MISVEGYINSKVDSKGIGTIEFFHPKHNALPSYLLDELVRELDLLSEDNACEIIILRSGGDRTFCAGASFDELLTIQNEVEGKQFFSGFASVINAIRKCDKLVIGRLQGKAVGGGVGIAAAVDYCFATKYSSIKLSELGIGIGPFVIGPAVQRKIGLSAFTALTLNYKEFLPPSWAKENGLFHEVFNSSEEMDLAIQSFANDLASTNPKARLSLKSLLWEGTENWDDLLNKKAEVSGKLILSSFARKSLAQFKNQ